MRHPDSLAAVQALGVADSTASILTACQYGCVRVRISVRKGKTVRKVRKVRKVRVKL